MYQVSCTKAAELQRLVVSYHWILIRRESFWTSRPSSLYTMTCARRCALIHGGNSSTMCAPDLSTLPRPLETCNSNLTASYNAAIQILELGVYAVSTNSGCPEHAFDSSARSTMISGSSPITACHGYCGRCSTSASSSFLLPMPIT